MQAHLESNCGADGRLFLFLKFIFNCPTDQRLNIGMKSLLYLIYYLIEL